MQRGTNNETCEYSLSLHKTDEKGSIMYQSIKVISRCSQTIWSVYLSRLYRDSKFVIVQNLNSVFADLPSHEIEAGFSVDPSCPMTTAIPSSDCGRQCLP